MAKVVLFDMGGTLITGFRDQELLPICEEVAKKFSRLRSVLLDAPARYEVQRAEDLKILEQHTFIDAFLDAYNDARMKNPTVARGISDEKLQEVFDCIFALAACETLMFPETIFVLEWLHAHGKRLGVVSNVAFEGRRYETLLEIFGIRKYFDVCVWSSDLGIRKPHPDIFRTALDLMDADVEKTLFVGDKLDRDIRGAQGAGIRAVWVNRWNEKIDPAIATPDHEILDLRGVLDIVKK